MFVCCSYTCFNYTTEKQLSIHPHVKTSINRNPCSWVHVLLSNFISGCVMFPHIHLLCVGNRFAWSTERMRLQIQVTQFRPVRGQRLHVKIYTQKARRKGSYVRKDKHRNSISEIFITNITKVTYARGYPTYLHGWLLALVSCSKTVWLVYREIITLWKVIS